MSFVDCPVIESLTDPHHREIGELWGTKYWRRWRNHHERVMREKLAKDIDCSTWRINRAWYADNVTIAMRAAIVLYWTGDDEISGELAEKRRSYLESLTYRLREGR